MMVLHYSDAPRAELLPNEMVCSVLPSAALTVTRYHIMPTFRPPPVDSSTPQSKTKYIRQLDFTVIINIYPDL